MECKTHSSIFTDFLNDLDCERKQKIEVGSVRLDLFFFNALGIISCFLAPEMLKTQICIECHGVSRKGRLTFEICSAKHPQNHNRKHKMACCQIFWLCHPEKEGKETHIHPFWSVLTSAYYVWWLSVWAKWDTCKCTLGKAQ